MAINTDAGDFVCLWDADGSEALTVDVEDASRADKYGLGCQSSGACGLPAIRKI